MSRDWGHVEKMSRSVASNVPPRRPQSVHQSKQSNGKIVTGKTSLLKIGKLAPVSGCTYCHDCDAVTSSGERTSAVWRGRAMRMGGLRPLSTCARTCGVGAVGDGGET